MKRGTLTSSTTLHYAFVIVILLVFHRQFGCLEPLDPQNVVVWCVALSHSLGIASNGSFGSIRHKFAPALFTMAKVKNTPRKSSVEKAARKKAPKNKVPKKKSPEENAPEARRTTKAPESAVVYLDSCSEEDVSDGEDFMGVDASAELARLACGADVATNRASSCSSADILHSSLPLETFQSSVAPKPSNPVQLTIEAFCLKNLPLSAPQARERELHPVNIGEVPNLSFLVCADHY